VQGVSEKSIKSYNEEMYSQQRSSVVSMEEGRNMMIVQKAVFFSVLLLMIGGISFSYGSQRLDIGSVPLRF
jgi:hypothetical protein